MTDETARMQQQAPNTSPGYRTCTLRYHGEPRLRDSRDVWESEANVFLLMRTSPTHPRRGCRPLYRATCVAQFAAGRSRWRSPRRQSRSPEPTSTHRFPPRKLSFSDLPGDAEHVQYEQGAFVAPGLWVDRWDVHVESGSDDPKVHARSALPRAVTPISPGHTRHAWRVSQNFALGEQVLPIFTDYY
jgi:hypothetical protein